MLSQTPSSPLQVKTLLNLSHDIYIDNPLKVVHLLLSNFPNYMKGSCLYDVLHDLLIHGIFSVDGNLWTIQCKIASHEFNTKSLKHFISNIVNSKISNHLIIYLSKICDKNRVIDLQNMLQKFGFDNICNVALGTDPACLYLENMNHTRSMSGLSFAKCFDDTVDICSSRLMSPLSLVWKMKRFFNIGYEKLFKQVTEEINKYAIEIIELKKAKSDVVKDGDLLSRFVSSSANIEFHNVEHKRRFLRDIVINFILAGRDNTSLALTWFFWLISGHLKKLHYLHAALSESMQLFPSVPINLRLTVDDEVLPDGFLVRKGWFANYSAYAMEFKPERWLDGDGVFQPSYQFRFPMFHCGPSMCLGKEMAYVQMKSVVAAVMYEFEVVVVNGGATAKKMMNPPYILSLVLKMKGRLAVRLHKRQR
ncbi:PREDICTED: cytochrome P450 94A1-like [Prunus mume]|uniref:Cytochrome P450 94A1-like n=1 Tax=Prunus mume TaxID=102107 RepID=A0ABM1LLK2_PRUMU|nr:PREDICTED: cytochrome P450 94A1-like [Prunus mume]